MKQIKTGLLLILVILLSSCGQLPDKTPSKSLPENAAEDPSSFFQPADLEPYSGQPYTIVGDNVPYFSEEAFTVQSFEQYSALDELGRCGPAYACIGVDLMPTEERGSIGSVKPTGWHTVKYNGIVDGNYLYNRCHLIGYSLSGENANSQNLITGTRYLNIEGMLPFESKVADYVKETGNHVLYRVTPVFGEDNLLAFGVLMEAESVEDKGAGICFCVYAYNVQPGIVIDYATGESSLASQSTTFPTWDSSDTQSQNQGTQPPDHTSGTASDPSQEDPTVETTYILNTNTHKFHHMSCPSVNQMKEKNRQEYTGSRKDVISLGYEPCQNCTP